MVNPALCPDVPVMSSARHRIGRSISLPVHATCPPFCWQINVSKSPSHLLPSYQSYHVSYSPCHVPAFVLVDPCFLQSTPRARHRVGTLMSLLQRNTPFNQSCSFSATATVSLSSSSSYSPWHLPPVVLVDPHWCSLSCWSICNLHYFEYRFVDYYEFVDFSITSRHRQLFSQGVSNIYLRGIIKYAGKILENYGIKGPTPDCVRANLQTR